MSVLASVHSVDEIFLVIGQFHTQMLHLLWKIHQRSDEAPDGTSLYDLLSIAIQFVIQMIYGATLIHQKSEIIHSGDIHKSCMYQ